MQIFSIFLHLFFVIQVFTDPGGGGRKPPYGFNNKSLKNLYWPWTFIFFNITIFFHVFSQILSVFTASRTEESLGFDNRLLYSFEMRWNVFQDFNTINFGIFLQNLQFLSIFFTFVVIQVFQPNRKSSLSFDNKLLENVFRSWISFQLLLSQILAVFVELAFF